MYQRGNQTVHPSQFKNLKGHWWNYPNRINGQVLWPANHVQSAGPEPNLYLARWEHALKTGEYDGVEAVFDPLVFPGGKDVALTKGGDFLVGFDVYWKGNEKPSSKGYMPLPSPKFFYDRFMQSGLPLEARTFYQAITTEKSCGLYFDLDSKDLEYDVLALLEALFQEIALKTGKTLEQMWRDTLLLDACKNVSGELAAISTHGVHHTIVFENNYDHMKSFMGEIFDILDQRPELKDCYGVLPLDMSVYSRDRCFRMLGNVKQTVDPAKRRPLVIAPYNRYPVDGLNGEDVFLLSIVPQGVPVTVETQTAVGAVSISRRKKQQRNQVHVPVKNDFLQFLLNQVRGWGNYNARINSAIQQRRNKMYIAFSGAQIAVDHKHQSNNVYAVAYRNKDNIRIHWKCHGNDCHARVQTLKGR